MTAAPDYKRLTAHLPEPRFVPLPGYTRLSEADRRPACVMACPTSARIFGDIHDPQSDASRAIRENGGYALMPEWGTQPANHYLPRRTTRLRIHEDELVRSDNPLRVEGHLPKPADDAATLDDASW